MRRNTTLSRGSAFPAALGNALQDEQEGLIPASDTPQIAIKGADGRWWNTPPITGLASGATRVVDANGDWRGRIVWGVLHVLGAADRKPGLGNDYLINDPTAGAWVRVFEGWTGTGGVGAASATVADGTPPVIASGSYAVILDEGATSAARVWLYARPSDGALCLYNASGATLHAMLRVYGAAAAITGAPPPDVIPTLTLVAWLTPSLAAARPADPGGPAMHHATDTDALTYFDGTTWRPFPGGGSSPTTTAGDMIVRGASADQRLAIGADGYVLTVSSGAPAWTSAPWVTATGTILTGRVLAWDGSAWVATALSPSYVGAVPVARTITSGTGLSGGGDLSADRTLSVSFGSSSGTACEGNDSRLSNSRAPTAHASTHATGGGDAITPGDIGAASFATGLDAARPAASAGLVGQVYYATNSGIDYRCISSSTWRVVGARGAVEGFDTTAVALSPGVNATGNTYINAGVVASIVCCFAIPSSPSGVGIIASGGEWQLEIGNNSGDRYQLSLYRAGFGTARVTLGTVSGSPTTLHTVAITFSGTTTSYSLDGGAVQTASHVSGSASGNNPLHFSSASWPTVAQVTTLGLWSTALSNADLVVASAAYATGRIPTVTGTLYSLWHAGWFTAGVLTQQLQVGALGGTLTWTGFPLVLK